MNTLYHDIVIDLAHMGFPESVTVKQYDDQIPHVRVELRQNGVKYVIPSGTTLRMQGTKPDKTHFMHDAIRTDDGRIDCPLTNQILAAEGPILAEIRLTDTTGELATFNFYILAQKAALTREDIESSDDYQSIDKIKADTLQYKKDAEAAKAAAEAAKEAAAGSANTATQQAQTAQLEARKVKQIVAGNEAYTKTESDLKYTIAPRKEASSDTGELKLTDADDGLSYLALQGNSEQYTNTANKNLIDLHFATDGYYVNNVNGALAVNPNYKASGYINVIPGESYFLTNGSNASPGAMYNANKAYVQGVTIGLNVIPEGVKYVRISAINSKDIAYTTQFEKGTQGTEIVIGAVDTPSPEYPSEVRSVGDIPKDVNGVEIRNLLDEDWIRSLTESDFTKAPNNRVYYIDVSGRLPKSYLFTKGFLVGDKVNIQVFLSDTPGNGSAGHCAFFVGQNGTPVSYGYDASKYDTMVLNFYVESITFDMVLAAIKNYKFMVTSAAEIDEYRPYIGENNGLVKMESTGKNLAINSEIIGQEAKQGVTVTMNEDQTFNINGTLTADYYNFYRNRLVPLDAGETYTITSNLNSPNLNIVLQKVDNNAEPSTWVVLKKGQNKVTTTFDGENLKGCNIVIQPMTQGSSYDERNIYVQIEKGNAQTEYQAYHQQITWIPLKEPLRKITEISTYQDSIDQDGFVTQCILKCVLDGSIGDIYGGPTKEDLIGFSVNVESLLVASSRAVWCNKLAYLNTPSDARREGCAEANTTLTIIVKKARLESADLAGFKKWLSDQYSKGEPVIAYPATITPIAYQIPAVYIETYDQETNVRCLNKVKPSDMTLDYKIAMSSLIKRLEALEEKTVQEV